MPFIIIINMKNVLAISLPIALSYAFDLMRTDSISEAPEKFDMPSMNMTMDMHMYFWSGYKMNFLWENAESRTTMQFILGLVCCFIGSIIFELLQHYRTKLYYGKIYELAQRDSSNA